MKQICGINLITWLWSNMVAHCFTSLGTRIGRYIYCVTCHIRYDNGRNAECRTTTKEEKITRDHLTTTEIITGLLYARRRAIVTRSSADCNLLEFTIYIFTLN